MYCEQLFHSSAAAPSEISRGRLAGLHDPVAALYWAARQLAANAHRVARQCAAHRLCRPLRSAAPYDKHREPLTPFADYVARRREDGLPYDSWVRTHVRAGAEIVKVVPRSMVIAGTIAEWSRWIPALASPRAARRSYLAPRGRDHASGKTRNTRRELGGGAV